MNRSRSLELFHSLGAEDRLCGDTQRPFWHLIHKINFIAALRVWSYTIPAENPSQYLDAGPSVCVFVVNGESAKFLLSSDVIKCVTWTETLSTFSFRVRTAVFSHFIVLFPFWCTTLLMKMKHWWRPNLKRIKTYGKNIIFISVLISDIEDIEAAIQQHYA